jgi:hypothetical protein
VCPPMDGPKVGGGTVLSEDPRTGEQLRAEIADLKRQIETRRASVATAVEKATLGNQTRRPRAFHLAAGPESLSRRAALTMWLVPGILVVPAVRGAEQILQAFKRRITP